MTTSPESLWRNRSFNLLWSSQTLSDLGSNMSTLAFPLLVLAVTGSSVLAGIVGTVAAVTRVVVRIPSGVLVDRMDRRRLMVICDAIRLLAFLLLGVTVAMDRATLPLILVVAAIEGVCTGAFNVAERSALPSLVRPDQVADATARNEARQAATSLIGPPLGGLLYGVGRAVPFFGDALSYALSLIGVALVRVPMQQHRASSTGSALGDLAEGVRFVWRQPFLRAVLLSTPLLNLAFNGMIFALILLFRRHGMAPGLIGTVGTIIGVAGLAGAILASTIRGRFSLRTLAVGVSWLAVVLISVSAPLTASLLAVVPVAAAVVLIPAINSAFAGRQAALTPDHLRGKVVAVDLTASMSLSALGPVIAGLTVAYLGGFQTMLVFAGIAALAALTVTLSRGIRTVADVEVESPDTAAAGDAASATEDVVSTVDTTADRQTSSNS